MSELDSIVAVAADVAREVVSRDASETDQLRRWPERGIRALLNAGLGGLVVNRRSGGLGFGLEALSRVCEQIGRYCPSTAICFGMHGVGSAVIDAKATESQRETYLEPIAAGRHITTLALSEPGSGAHFYFPQTTLSVVDPQSYAIRGTKSFVTNGGHADSYVISTVATDANVTAGQFSCLVVDGETPGMTWGGDWNGTGMRGNSSRTLTLDNALVDAANLLGKPGDQIWYVFNVVAPYFLMAMSGTYLGAADGALGIAVNHVKQRTHKHTGAPLAGLTVVQHRLGTLWATVERTRRLVYSSAARADEGAEDALPGVLSAKAEVAECANQVVGDAMTLVGGIGYAAGGQMERLLRDVRAAHVMAPTTDILRIWTGRALLQSPLLADM